MKRITIGTRASKLAMVQTQWVIEQLQKQNPALEIIIEHIHTTGDLQEGIPLTHIGGEGVFVKEIEHALMQRKIDLAIHSLKDVPTIQPQGLYICVVGTREDVRDVLLMNGQIDQEGIFKLDRSQMIRVGTCSLRRSAQMRALFPRAEILPLRGNVDTRLLKLEAGLYDAIVLAAAGIHRLGKREQLAHRMCYLPLECMMPAPGQGALALEFRNEPDIQALIAPLRNNAIHMTTSAERMFMCKLGVGCSLPIAAYAEIMGDNLILKGLVISLDGQQSVQVQGSLHLTSKTHIEDVEQLGMQLAEKALSKGASQIINRVIEMQFQGLQNA